MLAAFPASLSAAVAKAAAAMPTAALTHQSEFSIVVQGEQLVIPERLYNPEPSRLASSTLSRLESSVLDCIYTRDHDGFVRQRRLRRVIGVDEPWVVPFVLRLLGEYVIEIIVDIRDSLRELETDGSSQQRVYGEFIRQNEAFLELTSQRVMSYWDCYYRHEHRDRSTYPGFAVLASLRRAADHPS